MRRLSKMKEKRLIAAACNREAGPKVANNIGKIRTGLQKHQIQNPLWRNSIKIMTGFWIWQRRNRMKNILEIALENGTTYRPIFFFLRSHFLMQFLIIRFPLWAGRFCSLIPCKINRIARTSMRLKAKNSSAGRKRRITKKNIAAEHQIFAFFQPPVLFSLIASETVFY